MSPTTAAPAGQILTYSCPSCDQKGLYYYTDLALYDDERDPDVESVVPEHAPAVPGNAIDNDADVIICPRAECGRVQIRHIAFDLLPRTAVRVRRTTIPRPSNDDIRLSPG